MSHVENYIDRHRRTKQILIGGSIVGTVIAYFVLIPSIYAGTLPAHLTWGEVIIFPALFYGLVVAGMLWAMSRDLRRARERDSAEQKPENNFLATH